MMQGIEEAKYVGEEDVDGVKADHVSIVTADFQSDIWVTKGEKPTLVKVVPDMMKALSNTAMAPELGTPKVSNGTIAPAVAALIAASESAGYWTLQASILAEVSPWELITMMLERGMNNRGTADELSNDAKLRLEEQGFARLAGML
jgi:hypothetical protein